MSIAVSPTSLRWSRWMNAWTTLSLPGVGVALLAWGPATVLGSAATVAVPLTMIVFLLVHGRDQWSGPTTKVNFRWLGRVVLCVVTLIVSSAALFALFAPLAPLWVLAVIISCPPAFDLARRMLGRTAPDAPRLVPVEPLIPRGSSLPPGVLAQTARTMTEAELCRAWRRTFWTLKEAASPAEKLCIVDQRHCLLDELETRNAAAVQAWLASDKARACGGLEHFFQPGGGDESTAA